MAEDYFISWFVVCDRNGISVRAFEWSIYVESIPRNGQKVEASKRNEWKRDRQTQGELDSKVIWLVGKKAACRKI